MKLYNKLGWAVLPFALLAASCQNDDFMEAGHEAAEGVMTLHATMAPQTRAQIALGTEDESREIFMWNEVCGTKETVLRFTIKRIRQLLPPPLLFRDIVRKLPQQKQPLWEKATSQTIQV